MSYLIAIGIIFFVTRNFIKMIDKILVLVSKIMKRDVDF